MKVLLFVALAVLTLAESSDEVGSVPQRSTEETAQCSADTCACTNGSVTCSDGDGDTCPPALFCKDGHCECAGGHYPNDIILCNGTRSFVLKSYCATFDETQNVTVVGICLSQFKQRHNRTVNEDLYYTRYNLLPENVSDLDYEVCDSLSRTGVQCGQCKEDHFPLVYSVYLNCVCCPNVRWNWLWYVLAAYLPLTILYLIILFFKVNTTSSYLFAVGYYCQTVSMPFQLRILFRSIDTNSFYSTGAKIVFSIYGIWNLDFFRPFYSGLCLRIGILPTLALDYAIAAYPLFLIIITYLLIVLYEKNYRSVTTILSPFRTLFLLYRKKWNIRTSLIDSFATFFYLSNVKFLSASFDILSPSIVYRLYQDKYNHTIAPSFAGNIEYFGKEHLPYAVLAIVVLCVFVVLPTAVLACYPFSLFQKFLNLFPLRWYVLHTFVDSFHGCYKNGTEPNTCDCRWFAAVFFVLRLGQFLLYIVSDSNVLSISLMIIVLIFLTTLIATLQPFRHSVSHYNVIAILFLHFLVLFFVPLLSSNSVHVAGHSTNSFIFVEAAVITCLPILYAVSVLLYWVYKYKTLVLIRPLCRWQAWRKGYSTLPPEASEGLPDSLENSRHHSQENLDNFRSSPLVSIS